MKHLVRFLSLLLLAIAATPASAAANLQFHWQDEFSKDEQHRLVAWIEETDAAIATIVGPLPFTRHIFFHRRDSARGPVPWAHTQRGEQQGVHLHVDTSYTDQAFRKDWTAPHELSHLIIPYLGENYAWYAEGFASYMQYQVMGAMGVLAEEDIAARYQSRFQRAEGKYALDNLPFATAAPKLRAARQYPTMYWGGAIYFWQVNQWLAAHTETNLIETIRAYVGCCRRDVSHVKELTASLDQLVSGEVFSRHMDLFRHTPGFPKFN